MTDFSYSPSDAVMGAFRTIESGGNPNAQTGSYKGLYQLSQPEFDRYGGQGSIFDPAENTRVARQKITDEGNQLSQALGRPATDAEVYLAHQQGVGGATAHLQNPDQPAWKSMASTAEGRQKGDAWARQAIWGNVPAQYRDQFGSVDNITSGQFAQMWGDRFGRAMGQPGAPVAQTGYRAPAPTPQAGGASAPAYASAPTAPATYTFAGTGAPAPKIPQFTPPPAPQIYYAPRPNYQQYGQFAQNFQSPYTFRG